MGRSAEQIARRLLQPLQPSFRDQAARDLHRGAITLARALLRERQRHDETIADYARLLEQEVAAVRRVSGQRDAAHAPVPYRLGLPPLAEVRWHEENGGGWWMIIMSGGAVAVERLGLTADGVARCTVDGDAIDLLRPLWCRILPFRPCTPDGTPIPWPEGSHG